MTAEWSLPAWAVLVTLVALGVALAVVVLAALSALRRAAARAEASSAAANALSEDLRAQVSAIEERLRARTPSPGAGRDSEREYVITQLGDLSGRPESSRPEAAPVVDGPLFADLVLRESLVQAASLAAGLRRALAPAHLNQVRFEMRREIKRARKQRRADLRQARREFEARERDPARDGEVAA